MTDRKTALAGQLAALAPTTSHASEVVAPMAAEQGRPDKWPARISMKASPQMKRDLELARLDDGIEMTARIRAMITLWQSDKRIRGQVDKLAKNLR